MRTTVRPLLPILLAVLCMASMRLAAQVESQPLSARMGRAQPFYFDALNFGQYTEFGMTSRLDIYVHVPFDIITFVKKEEMYIGAYSITVTVTDENGVRLKEDSWDRKIEKAAFESTVNPNFYDLTQRTISLEPGTVQIELLYEDRESKKEFRLTKQVPVRKFDKNIFSMSDMMLVSQVQTKDGRKSVTPQIDPNVAGLTSGFSVFYEVYNPLSIDKIYLEHSIEHRGIVVLKNSETQPLHPGLNTFITRINASALSVGPYTASVTARRIEDTTDQGILVKGSKSFIVEWLSGGTPISITDLDEAIEQLRYFAKSDDLSAIKDVKDPGERRKAFEAFWEKNNPTPGTTPNRAMVEYYTRVAYANEHFKHYIDGWKTDRGMVYIIYGTPSYVDRHPVDVESKPYEMWEYYDINRRFIFVDDSGFGDYRLLYPIWDDRNRLR